MTGICMNTASQCPFQAGRHLTKCRSSKVGTRGSQSLLELLPPSTLKVLADPAGMKTPQPASHVELGKVLTHALMTARASNIC